MSSVSKKKTSKGTKAVSVCVECKGECSDMRCYFMCLTRLTATCATCVATDVSDTPVSDTISSENKKVKPTSVKKKATSSSSSSSSTVSSSTTVSDPTPLSPISADIHGLSAAHSDSTADRSLDRPASPPSPVAAANITRNLVHALGKEKTFMGENELENLQPLDFGKSHLQPVTLHCSVRNNCLCLCNRDHSLMLALCCGCMLFQIPISAHDSVAKPLRQRSEMSLSSDGVQR